MIQAQRILKNMKKTEEEKFNHLLDMFYLQEL